MKRHFQILYYYMKILRQEVPNVPLNVENNIINPKIGLWSFLGDALNSTELLKRV